MLVGTAVGLVAGIGTTVLVKTPIRPDVVIGLIIGVPTVVGLALILASRRRAVAMLGAFALALSPGWFGALAAVEVVHGG